MESAARMGTTIFFLPPHPLMPACCCCFVFSGSLVADARELGPLSCRSATAMTTTTVSHVQLMHFAGPLEHQLHVSFISVTVNSQFRR